jgi:membrane protein YqaA with SNARE-associated domain
VSFFHSLSARLAKVLALYGSLGLCAMSFLDSSFLPFPGVNDLALIIAASRYPGHAVLYTAMSTIGSVLGCYVIYYLARGGQKLATVRRAATQTPRPRRWLERNDFLAMLIAGLLPPPAPLKVFVAAAGVLRMNALRFGAAMVIGRGVRFAAEAWLGARYGTEAEAYLKNNLTWTSIVAIVVIVVVAVLARRLKRRSAAPSDESVSVPEK